MIPDKLMSEIRVAGSVNASDNLIQSIEHIDAAIAVLKPYRCKKGSELYWLKKTLRFAKTKAWSAIKKRQLYLGKYVAMVYDHDGKRLMTVCDNPKELSRFFGISESSAKHIMEKRVPGSSTSPLVRKLGSQIFVRKA